MFVCLWWILVVFLFLISLKVYKIGFLRPQTDQLIFALSVVVYLLLSFVTIVVVDAFLERNFGGHLPARLYLLLLKIACLQAHFPVDNTLSASNR